MAIYSEFTNLDTGLEFQSVVEFDQAATGTHIRRNNGKEYIKNSDGAWDLYDAATSINDTTIEDVYNKTELVPADNDRGEDDAGSVLDTRFYSQHSLLPNDNNEGDNDSGSILDARYFTEHELLPHGQDAGVTDEGDGVLDSRYYTQNEINSRIATAGISDLTTFTSFGDDPDSDVTGTYTNLQVKNDSHTHDVRYYTKTDSDSIFMPIHTHPYDNYSSWTARDNDNQDYAITSGDTLKFTEGTAMEVIFTADDVLRFTNTAPNVTTNLSTNYSASNVTILSSDGADALINSATTSNAGVMSSADKSKLDTISGGSDYYGYWTAKDGDGTTYTITGRDTLQFSEGTGIDVNFSADDVLRFTNTAPNVTTNISTTHNSSDVKVNSSDGTDGTINAATTSLAGVMSSADKSKLNAIATGANNYTHPSYNGDDINLDTGAMSGATVLSDLDFNVTTDGLGHVTDANATYSTRNLTYANIGAAPTTHYHTQYLEKAGGTITGVILPSTNGSLNLGGSSNYFQYLYGTALKARYADLAEKYESDEHYEVGTVVEIGGEKEITEFNGGALAGIISLNPGLELNSAAGDDYQYVALKGKVPAKCEGNITKGQYCVATKGGKVKGYNKSDIIESQHFDIVGVALEDSKDNMVMVKV